MKASLMKRIEQKIIKLYGLILLIFKRFDLIKYFSRRYFLTFIQRFRKNVSRGTIVKNKVDKKVKTRKFLGRLCGYSKESYFDKEVMNYEKAHLKAYLNGNDYFKYKGKQQLVLKTF